MIQHSLDSDVRSRVELKMHEFMQSEIEKSESRMERTLANVAHEVEVGGKSVLEQKENSRTNDDEHSFIPLRGIQNFDNYEGIYSRYIN